MSSSCWILDIATETGVFLWRSSGETRKIWWPRWFPWWEPPPLVLIVPTLRSNDGAMRPGSRDIGAPWVQTDLWSADGSPGRQPEKGDSGVGPVSTISRM